MIILVVGGTYSESEGVHRRPSQNAIGITKFALGSLLSLFVGCDRQQSAIERAFCAKWRIGSVSLVVNYQWFYSKAYFVLSMWPLRQRIEYTYGYSCFHFVSSLCFALQREGVGTIMRYVFVFIRDSSGSRLSQACAQELCEMRTYVNNRANRQRLR